LGFLDVLQLIDEERHQGRSLLRGLPDDAQQVGQVAVEVATVGNTGLGAEIESDLHVCVLDPRRLDPASDGPQGAFGDLSSALHAVKAQNQLPQWRREQ
jgi:hypothetical protein